MSKDLTYGVFFSTKKCALYLKKMQFCVCFLNMFRPLKGWYILFQIICTFRWWIGTGIPIFNICVPSFTNKKLHYNGDDQQFFSNTL